MIATNRDVAGAVREILHLYPRLTMSMKGRNRPDPFVIAVARLRGAVVVTGEGANGTPDRPKIPYICRELRIPCMRFLELIRYEGWRF